MAAKRHNEVMILGVVFLLLGLALFFVDSGSLRARGTSNAYTSEGRSGILIIRDTDGNTVGVLDVPDPNAKVNHNAADDPAFRGLEDASKGESLWDFLGLYDFNAARAFKIIFLAAGGILILVSNIKTGPKKRYY